MLVIQLIIIQIITFTALVFVLRKIMYSASFGETKRLQQLNQENSKKAQELARKIEEAQKEYEQKIVKAQDEIGKLKSQAKEEADRLKDEVLSKAKQESEKIISQALNTKEKLKEELDAQMREKSIEQSVVLIQGILSSGNQESLHEGFIKEIIEEIDRLDTSKLQTKSDAGQILTPYPINDNVYKRIEAVLSSKTGKKISLEQKSEKNIIAGITIKLGSLVIDGSLAGKLKEASDAARKG